MASLAGAGVLGAATVAGIALAGGASAAPAPGEFCSPKGGIYKTSTQTLLCAPTKKDSRFRWRTVMPDRALICDSKHPETKVTLQASNGVRYETLVCAKRLPTSGGTTTTKSPTLTPTPTKTPTPTPTSPSPTTPPVTTPPPTPTTDLPPSEPA